MKNLIRFFALAACAGLLAAFGSAPNGVKTGTAAPDFSLSANDGKTYKLSDLKGKVVVLEWLNHLCPIDSKHYVGGAKGNMQTLQRTYTAKGVVWFSVISSAPGYEGYVDAAEANADLATFKAAPTAVLFDPTGKVGHQFDAKTTPHMFIINKDGILVYQGGIDSTNPPTVEAIAQSDPYFKKALDEVLAGKPVTRSDTKPYGCGIKYAD
jgi:hypothetical protein